MNQEVHLIGPGKTTWSQGERVLATWCMKPVGGDDVNSHAMDQVTCTECRARYLRAHKDPRKMAAV